MYYRLAVVIFVILLVSAIWGLIMAALFDMPVSFLLSVLGGVVIGLTFNGWWIYAEL